MNHVAHLSSSETIAKSEKEEKDDDDEMKAVTKQSCRVYSMHVGGNKITSLLVKRREACSQ